jgi:hypothetical protein
MIAHGIGNLFPNHCDPRFSNRIDLGEFMTTTMTMTELKQLSIPSAFGDFCAGFGCGIVAAAAFVAACLAAAAAA